MQNSIIAGIFGPDGTYLVQLLLEKSCTVFCIWRRHNLAKLLRIQEPGIHNNLQLSNCAT